MKKEKKILFMMLITCMVLLLFVSGCENKQNEDSKKVQKLESDMRSVWTNSSGNQSNTQSYCKEGQSCASGGSKCSAGADAQTPSNCGGDPPVINCNCPGGTSCKKADVGSPWECTFPNPVAK